jgi:hypothetical protein
MNRRWWLVALVLCVTTPLTGRADWPPGSLRGMIVDATTGEPVAMVSVTAFYDGMGGRCEGQSAPDGTYRIGVQGVGGCVVYQAVGYRVRALRWPEELSATKQEERLGFQIRQVKLEPVRPRDK